MTQRGQALSGSGKFLASIERRLCLPPADTSQQKASQRLRNGERPAEGTVNDILGSFVSRIARPEVLGLPSAAIDPTVGAFLLRWLHMVLPRLDRPESSFELVEIACDVFLASPRSTRLELALRLAAWHRLRGEAVPSTVPTSYLGEKDDYLRARFADAGFDSQQVRDAVNAEARSVDGWLAGGPLVTDAAIASVARALRSATSANVDAKVIQGELRLHYAIRRLVRDMTAVRSEQLVLDECQRVLEWACCIDEYLAALGDVPGHEPSDLERSISAEWTNLEPELASHAFALGVVKLGPWRLGALTGHARATGRLDLADAVYAEVKPWGPTPGALTSHAWVERELARRALGVQDTEINGSAADLLSLFSQVPEVLAEHDRARERLLEGRATDEDELTLAESDFIRLGPSAGRAALGSISAAMLETPRARLLDARISFAEGNASVALDILDALCGEPDAPSMAHVIRVVFLVAGGQRQRAREAAAVATRRGLPLARYIIELANQLTPEQLRDVGQWSSGNDGSSG